MQTPQELCLIAKICQQAAQSVHDQHSYHNRCTKVQTLTNFERFRHPFDITLVVKIVRKCKSFRRKNKSPGYNLIAKISFHWPRLLILQLFSLIPISLIGKQIAQYNKKYGSVIDCVPCWLRSIVEPINRRFGVFFFK